MGTGHFDKNCIEMKVGDLVHFRTDGLSGKGIVFKAEEGGRLGSDPFKIRHTREEKQKGWVYPYYPEAVYRIESKLVTE